MDARTQHLLNITRRHFLRTGSLGLGGLALSLLSGDTTSGFWRPGLISLFLGLVYFGFLWARSGQSVGYMAMGIRLVRADGGQVSFALGMFRYLVLYLSVVVCAVPALISAFMVGMGQRKQVKRVHKETSHRYRVGRS